jgi:hypothetical protein
LCLKRENKKKLPRFHEQIERVRPAESPRAPDPHCKHGQREDTAAQTYMYRNFETARTAQAYKLDALALRWRGGTKSPPHARLIRQPARGHQRRDVRYLRRVAHIAMRDEP